MNNTNNNKIKYNKKKDMKCIQTFLKDDVYDNISNIKKKYKVTDKDFYIIKMNEYDLLTTHQFKVNQLKQICSHYQINKTGNKDELINKIYNFLKYSLFTINIQKIMRGYLLRKYILLAGPAFKKRLLCINDTDFATLEPLKEIPFNQFYSFIDSEDNIYGCDIISLYGLIYKNTKYVIRQQKIPLNPYNRKPIDKSLIDNFSQYLRLADVIKIDHIFEEEVEIIDPKKQIELKIIDIFQYINELGNYADSKWFSELPRHMMVLFIREIYDIWNYRAQLTIEVMKEIVPPHGNPFMGMNLHLAQNQTDDIITKYAISLIDLLIKSGHTSDRRSLGAYYVLAALTLVSDDARSALPWLFQAVAH
jgi:hypothetical protein